MLKEIILEKEKLYQMEIWTYVKEWAWKVLNMLVIQVFLIYWKNLFKYNWYN